MKDVWRIPAKITLSRSVGFDVEISVALGNETRRQGIEDARIMAVRLLREALEQRGALPLGAFPGAATTAGGVQ